MAESPPPAEFDALSIEDRIEYVQRLWDRIAASPERVPVPDWHREVIRERLAAHRASPGDAASWDDVRADVEQAVRKRRD
jgi:putative addiction module component (TIGR02574 family)